MTFMGVEINRMSNPSARRIPRRRESSVPIDIEKPNIDETTGGDSVSGIYLGILNLFTTLPQFIGTFISMIVFGIVEKGKGLSTGREGSVNEGPSGISICLFIGAICALGAAYATQRLKRILA